MDALDHRGRADTDIELTGPVSRQFPDSPGPRTVVSEQDLITSNPLNHSAFTSHFLAPPHTG